MRSERAQLEALDGLCDELGLARGVYTQGRKHGKYVVALPGGREVFVSISKTPREIEQAVDRGYHGLKMNIARVMGWVDK